MKKNISTLLVVVLIAISCSNDTKQEMIRVKGGTFEMGDVMGDIDRFNHDTVHSVTLSDFLIGKHEVTFEEYDAFCTATGRMKPSDKGWGRGRRPVIIVSWDDAVAYCNWRSVKEGLTKVYTINSRTELERLRKAILEAKGRSYTISDSTVTANWQANGYRLPTEAEWEYAAREGGKKVRFGNGKDIADPKEINFVGSAEYKEPYSVVGKLRARTVPVGSLNSPNALGLHDMSGNVWEWCWDWYGLYPAAAQTNPKGPNTSSARVVRGGSWGNGPADVRVADRIDGSPDYRGSVLGFRLARTL